MDESIRGDALVLAGYGVLPGHDERLLERRVRATIPSRQRRPHASSDSHETRRKVLSELSRLPSIGIVVVGASGSVLEQRHTCLQHLARWALDIGAGRIVLDHMDAAEQLADRATLAPIVRDRIPYQHMHSEHVPVLWGADYVAWTIGRSDYRARCPTYVETYHVP